MDPGGKTICLCLPHALPVLTLKADTRRSNESASTTPRGRQAPLENMVHDRMASPAALFDWSLDWHTTFRNLCAWPSFMKEEKKVGANSNSAPQQSRPSRTSPSSATVTKVNNLCKPTPTLLDSDVPMVRTSQTQLSQPQRLLQSFLDMHSRCMYVQPPTPSPPTSHCPSKHKCRRPVAACMAKAAGMKPCWEEAML